MPSPAADHEPEATETGPELPPASRGTPTRRRGAAEENRIRGIRALEMRMAGATYAQIATAMQWRSPQAAWDAVQRALTEEENRSAEARTEYRKLDNARLERIIRAWWPKALDVQNDPVLADKATTHVVRLLERRARLLGLDAPQQVILTDDRHELLAGLVAQMRDLAVPLPPIALGNGHATNGEVIDVDGDG